MANGWGALVLAAGALACGGVATGGTDDPWERDPRERDLPVAGTTGFGSGPAFGEDDPAYGGASSSRPMPIRPVGGAATSGGAGGSWGGNNADAGTDATDGGEPSHGGGEPVCGSPVTTLLAPFEPRASEDLGVSTQLALARRALVGDWHGFVTTPWVDPYQVALSFGESGSYSARCEANSDFGTTGSGGGCCRAFYYGSDRDSSLKQWSLTAVNADNSIEGNIDIAFCYDECYLPGWQGKLRRVQYDQSGNRIRFQFWRDDGYGPLEFDLERD